MTQNLSDGMRPVNKKKAREKERLDKLPKEPLGPVGENEDFDLVHGHSQGISRNEVYSRLAFMATAGIGERKFNAWIKNGLPYSKIGASILISGRLYAEWVESKTEQSK